MLECWVTILDHFPKIELDFLDVEEELEGECTSTPTKPSPTKPITIEPMAISKPISTNPASINPTLADPASIA